MGLEGPEEWHVARGNDDVEESEGDEDELWEEAAPGGWGGGGHAGRGRRRVLGGGPGWVMGVVAVVAAAVGVGVGLVFVHWPGAAVAAGPAASASAAPSASAGGGGGNGGLPALPPLSGNGNGEMQVSLIGKVVAVSGTSITLGGNGPSVTAAFTSSTTFGGKVTSPAGIKVGDQVSATVTGSSSKLTVASIQDPASAP